MERKHWKANEWRAFLLYYSPCVLYSALPRNFFKHWMLLVEAISILSSDSISKQDLRDAKCCLWKFVVDVERLFGKEF